MNDNTSWSGKAVELDLGLGVILAFVGMKMIMAEWYYFPTWTSLVAIAVVLAATVALSLRAGPRRQAGATSVTPPASHDGSTPPPTDRYA